MNSLNDDLSGIQFVFNEDGSLAGWKKRGADTVTPFKSVAFIVITGVGDVHSLLTSYNASGYNSDSSTYAINAQYGQNTATITVKKKGARNVVIVSAVRGEPSSIVLKHNSTNLYSGDGLSGKYNMVEFNVNDKVTLTATATTKGSHFGTGVVIF